jgi:hypothetical protein
VAVCAHFIEYDESLTIHISGLFQIGRIGLGGTNFCPIHQAAGLRPPVFNFLVDFNDRRVNFYSFIKLILLEEDVGFCFSNGRFTPLRFMFVRIFFGFCDHLIRSVKLVLSPEEDSKLGKGP